MSERAILKAAAITCRHGRRGALRDVFSNLDFQAGHGERVAVIGPSGGGKTTLLRALCGLAPLSSGCIRLEGRETWSATPASGPDKPLRRKAEREFRRRVRYVPQGLPGALNPGFDVLQLVQEPILEHGSMPRNAARAQAREVCAELGLEGSVLRSRPLSLSGGQARRVALARALSNPPALLLADEILVGLDDQAAIEVLQVLTTVAARRDLAVVLVTHDLRAALGFADRLLVLTRGMLFTISTSHTLPALRGILRSIVEGEDPVAPIHIPNQTGLDTRQP